MDAIHLHDPTALVAVLRPELFTWHSGAVRVAVEGVTRGQTVVDGEGGAGRALRYGGAVWCGVVG